MKGPEDPSDSEASRRRGSVRQRPDLPLPGGRQVRCGDRRRPENLQWLNSSGRCALLCGRDLIWDGSQKHFATVWLGVFAGLSVVLGTVALCAVATGAPKPRYPERPLVFITLCYGLSAIGYLARLLAGREDVACVGALNGLSILVLPGLQNVRCSLLFALVYYFNAAALLWWLILAATWSLATGLKWSPEAIELRAGWFHFPAWFLPALQTVAVLVRQSVDADELTGLCGVGFHSTEELFRFQILPALICLVVGMAMLTFGFGAGLTSCSQVRKQPGGSTTPSTSLYLGSGSVSSPSRQHYYVAGHLVKLGIFAAFHVVPQGAILAALFYEYSYQDAWERLDGPVPSFATFILKIVASLIFGIFASLWLLCRRIFANWSVGRFGQQKALHSALAYQPHRPVFASKDIGSPPTKLAPQYYPNLYHHTVI